MQLPFKNCIDVDADGAGHFPSPRSSAIPFSWEQYPKFLESLSHLAVVEDVSAHPLPPPPPPPSSVRSHSKVSTTCKKRSISSPDPFVAVLALCFSGLPHDGGDMDEL
ncbi:hypothetical protein BHM03_00050715 [Ensete ventricosum]|nr:hypothetical protein BHM03_00050715 [Ensete ventricosum]